MGHRDIEDARPGDCRANVSRRQVMYGAAAGMALLATGVFAEGAAAAEDGACGSARPVDAGVAAEQYGFLMNVVRCIECGKCVEACRLWSRTPEEAPARRKIVNYLDGAGREVHISMSCMHCADPSCMRVCPAGAISKGSGGIVTVDLNRCIGCKYCYQACPFEAPHYNSLGMDKCDCCLGAGVAAGEPPHCVQACKTGALRYGKLDDLLAISDRVRKIEGPTDPSMVLV